MALEPFAGVPVAWGVVYGLIGVGIWVGGLLFFNWVWNHYRGGESGATSDTTDTTDASNRSEVTDTGETTEPAESPNGDRV